MKFDSDENHQLRVSTFFVLTNIFLKKTSNRTNVLLLGVITLYDYSFFTYRIILLGGHKS